MSHTDKAQQRYIPPAERLYRWGIKISRFSTNPAGTTWFIGSLELVYNTLKRT